MALITDRVDEDDVRVVDFPQHLLNASFSTPRSVHRGSLHKDEICMHFIIIIYLNQATKLIHTQKLHLLQYQLKQLQKQLKKKKKKQ